MPSNPTARRLIKLTGRPVAAPSANLSGRPSPTTADDVLEDMDGRIDAVIMGEQCDVGIESTVVGNADLLIFPNIESSNTFYKAISLFGQACMAGMLTGTSAPVVLPSRADSDDSKYYSLVLACTMAG